MEFCGRQAINKKPPALQLQKKLKACKHNNPTWSLNTGREGITIVAVGTRADGIVVDDVTLGVDAAHTDTGRHTL